MMQPMTNKSSYLSRLSSKVWHLAGWIGMIVLIVGLFTLALHQPYTSSGSYRKEYKGRIVDRRITFRESQLGSRRTRRLFIQGRNGELFNVVASEDVYERAQVGMWIKSSKAGVELFPSDPEGNAVGHGDEMK